MRLYNTLTGGKEDFITLEPGKVNMYVCGPTTYNYIHLGNARPLVVFDTVRRYLTYKGYQVRYIQNFTDVDDKILNRAAQEGLPPLELSGQYIAEYYTDADALGIKRADVHPRVSEHIDDIIAAIGRLIETGYAYEIDGDVYYRVKAFAQYGCLSHRTVEDMLAGARVEVDTRKEEPVDFALWKKAKVGELCWNSPWGKGRPGWHIECSVMANRYLGDTVDIHGGGNDLIFPHHENEIAQAEALTGKTFVNYWLHNGFITVNSTKMSKSLGNFFILRDILAQYPAEVVRFYLISTHYRSPLDFDDGKLTEARKAWQRLKTTQRLVQEFCEGNAFDGLVVHKGQSLSGLYQSWRGILDSGPEAGVRLLEGENLDEDFVNGWSAFHGNQGFVDAIDGLRHQFMEAMDDDFNTAKAIGFLFEMAREINVFISSAKKERLVNRLVLYGAGQVFEELGGILGLLEDGIAPADGLADEVLALLGAVRNKARAEKNYRLADDIRDFLNGARIVIEDTPQGSRFIYEPGIDVPALINQILKIRDRFKQTKDYAWADAIRHDLGKAGIVIEDTKEGSRWKTLGG